MPDTADDERCAAAKMFQRIDAAFRTGDLEALRAAVNERMACHVGSYAAVPSRRTTSSRAFTD